MKTLLVLLSMLSVSAFAADRIHETALEGKNAGRLCRMVVTEVLQAHFKGGPIILLTYTSSTPGSYDQKFTATFTRGTGRKYTAELTGKFDCDSLKVQSIR